MEAFQRENYVNRRCAIVRIECQHSGKTRTTSQFPAVWCLFVKRLHWFFLDCGLRKNTRVRFSTTSHGGLEMWVGKLRLPAHEICFRNRERGR